MEMKISNYIADFMANNGIETVFTVTGGGAMHLNDAFGHDNRLQCIYNHHEQACAMAAEGYTRLSGKLACVCVTSGPGGTNAITGVLGGWVDSIPMFIISGQVKRETTIWSTDIPLRQLGDQEYNIVDSVKPMTKYACMITEPNEIRYHLEKALYLSTHGRGGPVWLDIPLDVQAAKINVEELKGFHPQELKEQEVPVYDSALTGKIIKKIQTAKCPVILAGTGIRLANAHKEFLSVITKLQIPVVTAWNAHDVLWDEHNLYCGRPGTLGTRGGNFVVQNCDLLIVFGCRLNIRMVSYNYKNFAKNAYKIIVDIDKHELQKPTIKCDMGIWADVKDVLLSISQSDYIPLPIHTNWLEWCKDINEKYPATLPGYYTKNKKLNPYVFVNELCKTLTEEEIVVTGNGSACVVTFQAARIKKNQRYFTNSGCAAMGYGFPAAIGACVSQKGKRVICIDGDGSFQMNLQELQTVAYNNLNLKIFYLNNNGYHSIRQTQNNIFHSSLVGVCDGNGISFPSAEKLSNAYGIAFERIDSVHEIPNVLKKVFETEAPVFCEIVLDETQNFEPKLASRLLEDGTFETPDADDMYPFLSREEYNYVKESLKDIKG